MNASCTENGKMAANRIPRLRFYAGARGVFKRHAAGTKVLEGFFFFLLRRKRLVKRLGETAECVGAATSTRGNVRRASAGKKRARD